MQTFLPHPDFLRSAQVLDSRRLGKQRVEGYQILRTLTGVTAGWARHPAVRMWRGYERALRVYTLVMGLEWMRRGYRDTVTSLVAAMSVGDGELTMPPWLGDARVHSSHRAALLHKDPDWYGKYGWTETPANRDYWWPFADR